MVTAITTRHSAKFTRRLMLHPTRRCTSCGLRGPGETPQPTPQKPNHAANQRWLDACDLDITWLIPAEHGSFVEARFCYGCAPTGTIIAIECADCDDGPLILLNHTPPNMTAADQNARQRALTHLHTTGWRDDGQTMRCPTCSL